VKKRKRKPTIKKGVETEIGKIEKETDVIFESKKSIQNYLTTLSFLETKVPGIEAKEKELNENFIRLWNKC